MTQLFFLPKPLNINANLQLVGGAKAYFSSTGTDTPQDTYVDADLTTPHSNPVVADSAGVLPPIYLKDTVSRYRLTLKTGTDALIYTVDPVNPFILTQSLIGGTLYPQTLAEQAAGITPVTIYDPGPIYDMRRVLLGENGVDNTVVVQKVYDMLKATGGEMIFPRGDWAFYLDVSSGAGAAHKRVRIHGQGSTFRPFSATPTNSTIIYCDNHLAPAAWEDSFLAVENATFDARTYANRNASSGTINYCANFTATAAKFWDCNFFYGKVAGFYAMYGQYLEFWTCLFAACAFDASSAGCVLDSAGNGASSNEVVFYRCKFQSNKNGLVLKGTYKVRGRDCNFQGTFSGGTGALVVDSDSTGSGAVANDFSGCYFEFNSVDHLHIGTAENTVFDNCIFATNGGTIYSVTCYDIAFINCRIAGSTTTTLNHPPGDTGVASLTWKGNNFFPTLALDHAGPTYLDMQSSPNRTERRDNMLLSSGQFDHTSMAMVQSHQIGFKAAVLRSTATPIFSISQEVSGVANAFRYIAFDLSLFAADDSTSTSSAGYSARIQRNYVFISNNNTGAPQVFISAAIDGVDLGVSTAFTAPGAITVTSAVAGDVITFSVQYAGTGTNPASTVQLNVGYEIRAMGCQTFTVNRL